MRQSYKRVTKQASLMVGRYLHARQMKRAKKKLKFNRTRLKRLTPDIERKAQAKFQDIPQKLKSTLEKVNYIAKQKRGTLIIFTFGMPLKLSASAKEKLASSTSSPAKSP